MKIVNWKLKIKVTYICLKLFYEVFRFWKLSFPLEFFVLVIGGVTALLIYAFRNNKIIWEQLSTQSEGRKAAQDFTNELRSATPSSIGAYPLAQALPQEIIFYTNLDSDSLRERVRYFLPAVP